MWDLGLISVNICIRDRLKITSSRHKAGGISKKMILDYVGEGGVLKKMMDDAESEGYVNFPLDYYKMCQMCQTCLNVTIKIIIFTKNAIYSVIIVTFRNKNVYNL